MKPSRNAAILALLAVLAGCSTPEVILQGVREPLRSEDSADLAAAAGEDRALAIRLPQASANNEWLQRPGTTGEALPHPMLSATPQLLWSAKIGEGNDRRHRITAQPVLAGGRVFTLDSRAQVAAHSTAGAALWVRDLTPVTDKSDDASGGGMTIGGGRLFVTSGFGSLSAIDPETGAVIWTQKLDAPASGAPSYRDGLVYVTTRDNRAWAIDAGNGRVKWQLEGTPGQSGIVGAASPAVIDRLAIFPFSSGEVVAALRKGGVRVWSALLTGERPGRGYSIVSDVTGEPVVAGGVLYAGNPVGRTVAMNLSGERLWTAREGAAGPVWAVGGSVFLISDEAELLRLDAGTGERIWGSDLPYYTTEKTKKRKAIYANYGPVLAGGRLWVASSDGILRGFDPVGGALAASVDIPGGAAARPIVAGGTLYVVTQKGELLALR